jgi:catechol 2,3-dioxygenase-like lactoylglutathione lyase family enzyme
MERGFRVTGQARADLHFGVQEYEPGTGYGHIAVTVDDIDDALERLAAQGIAPEREPYRVREGGSRLCFVADPDGYLRTWRCFSYVSIGTRLQSG